MILSNPFRHAWLAEFFWSALVPSISRSGGPSGLASVDEANTPGFEGNVDINDVYLFQSPTTRTNTVMIVTLSPAAGVVGPATFASLIAYYEIHVQNTAAFADNIVVPVCLLGPGFATAGRTSSWSSRPPRGSRWPPRRRQSPRLRDPEPAARLRPDRPASSRSRGEAR